MTRAGYRARTVMLAGLVLLAVLGSGGTGMPARAAAEPPVQLTFPQGVAGVSGSGTDHVSVTTDCYGVCFGTLAVAHGEGDGRIDVNGQIYALGGQCREGDEVVLAGVFLYFGSVEVGTVVPNPVTGESVPFNVQVPLPGVTGALITLHAGGAFDVELVNFVAPSLDPTASPVRPVRVVGDGGSFSISCY